MCLPPPANQGHFSPCDAKIEISHRRDIIAPITVASPASTQTQPGAQRRRRTSSAANKHTPSLNLSGSQPSSDRLGTTSGLGGPAQPLPPIPGTPYTNMSLSRSPSPRGGGGWSSPGLTSPYESGKSSPRRTYGDVKNNGSAGTGVTWETAKARSDEVKGHPSYSTQNQGFFSRNARRLSTSFMKGRDFSDREKLGRGRIPTHYDRAVRLLTALGRMAWRLRLRLGIVTTCILAFVLFYATRE